MTNESGAPLRFRLFDATKDGESAVEFVVSENMRRRHLSASQRAMSAAELLPFYEAEAKERQVAAGEANMAAHNKGDALVVANLPQLAGGLISKDLEKPAADEMSQETGFDPAEESQAPTPKNNVSKGRSGSAKQAAGKMNVSARSVQAARAKTRKS